MKTIDEPSSSDGSGDDYHANPHRSNKAKFSSESRYLARIIAASPGNVISKRASQNWPAIP